MATPALKRILYVEDEPDIRTITTIALQNVGKFSIKAFSNGEEALEHVAEFSPELILLDVMMPGMDGLSTFHALHSMPATAKIPVVFMTAKIMAEEMSNYRKIGTAGIISKPFDPMALHERITGIWEEYQTQMRLNEDKPEYLMKSYISRLQSLTEEILRLVAVLENSTESQLIMEKIYELAHSYAGSGGVFGFPRVSKAAEKVEAAALAWKQSQGAKDTGKIKELLLQLRNSCIGAISKE